MLKTLQTGFIPVTLMKVDCTSNGMHFFNSFRGSRIEEGVSLTFTKDCTTVLSIPEVKTKDAGTQLLLA